jgi:hypothetical protein
MRKLTSAAFLIPPLAHHAGARAEQRAVDPDLAQLRAAYTSGEGLAYVVTNDEKGELAPRRRQRILLGRLH